MVEGGNKLKNRPGFVRTWGRREVAHRGIYDRHAEYFLMPREFEDHLIRDECGGCLVSLYTMTLPVLTQRLLDWRGTQ